MDGWMGGWIDRWMAARAGFRIAYSNNKFSMELSYKNIKIVFLTFQGSDKIKKANLKNISENFLKRVTAVEEV